MLVALTKLAEAALLLLAALCAHRLLHGDVQKTILHWVAAVRIDPDNRFAHAILGKATGLSPRKLEALSLGTLMYGLLFAVEGVGLVLQKRWAEWVTVISTAGFLPLEIYEIVHHVRVVKIVVLVINLLIVIYLIIRLRAKKH
jgi:uncharacterized membrane protein (DUF2068 family)